jgi:hypothetical protein
VNPANCSMITPGCIFGVVVIASRLFPSEIESPGHHMARHDVESTDSLDRPPAEMEEATLLPMILMAVTVSPRAKR